MKMLKATIKTHKKDTDTYIILSGDKGRYEPSVSEPLT